MYNLGTIRTAYWPKIIKYLIDLGLVYREFNSDKLSLLDFFEFTLWLWLTCAKIGHVNFEISVVDIYNPSFVELLLNINHHIIQRDPIWNQTRTLPIETEKFKH